MQPENCFKLNNGVEIPLLGLGTWRAEKGQAREAVCFALQNGYRLIDTAAFYKNEEEVGAGLRDAGVNRSELFVTSKVWVDECSYEETLRAFEKSLARLGLEYMDMYMVHWPVEGKYRETCKALQELYRQKRIRAVGVSNFPARLLSQLAVEMDFEPMVNQLQFHPLYFRRMEYEYCKSKGILLQAWKPLARGELREDEGLLKIASAHGKSPEQVLLRWALQLGLGVIPKSVTPARILQNADVFHFSLAAAEMEYLTALDRAESLSKPPDGVVLH